MTIKMSAESVDFGYLAFTDAAVFPSFESLFWRAYIYYIYSVRDAVLFALVAYLFFVAESCLIHQHVKMNKKEFSLPLSFTE